MRSVSVRSGSFPTRLLILGTILGAACAAGAAEGDKPPDVDSPEVKWTVLAQLREPTKAEMAEFERMLRTIADEDAGKRDKALRQFLADPSPYLMWLRRIGRLSFGREEQKRLEELMSSNAEFRKAGERWEDAGRTARAENLSDRPDYLIPLLRQTKGVNRDAVVRRLGKVTRQSFAKDVGAWEKWWAKQKVWGRFGQFAPQVGDLIPLTLLDGALRLDRDHWAQVAAGIDREELRKQFEELCLRGHLGKHWALRAAKDAATGEDYRLVFARLQLATETTSGRESSSHGGRILLTASVGGFRAELTHLDDRFRIVLEESFGPRRRLELWDNARGGLLLTLIDGSEGSALILRQREDGRVVVGHVDRGQATCFSDRSFLAFCRAHSGYAEKEVFARLRRVGVSARNLPKIAAAPAPESRPAPPLPPEQVGQAQWKKGLLQEIPEDVGRVIGLTVGRDGLCVDRRHWQRRVERSDPVRIGKAKKELTYYFSPESRLFKDLPPQRADMLKNAALAMTLLERGCRDRWPGGSSGTRVRMGGRTMERHFSVSGAIGASLKISTSAIEISLTELQNPEREIEILDDGQGGLRILVNRSADGAFLMILQGPNGRFAVAEAKGEVFFTAAGTSFFEFYRKHRKYVEERLFGYLRHLGVAVPPRLYGQDVKDAVLFKLTGPSKVELLRATQLIVQLDHPEFRKRDEATRLLTAGFGRYREALGEARRDDSLSAEAKRRLETIFRDRPEVEKIEQIISDVGLLEGAGYLIELLAGTKGADRQAVAARLKKLTGRDLGNDPKAWEEWLSRRRPR